MSQWLDVQSGAAYYGDWGVSSSTTGASVSATANSAAVPTVKSDDKTMLYLTGAGVALAALALFRRGK